MKIVWLLISALALVEASRFSVSPPLAIEVTRIVQHK